MLETAASDPMIVHEEIAADAVIRIIDGLLDLRRALERPDRTAHTIQMITSILADTREAMRELRDALGPDEAGDYLESIGLADTDASGLPDIMDRRLAIAALDASARPIATGPRRVAARAG